ncbi:unnamed protein product [Linum trigynum]|uniref:CCHC-type domain-containing protein n=1 Tax=Linum trigynum TaxID=586398 RepID=A0AAV2CAX1_9ROSI
MLNALSSLLWKTVGVIGATAPIAIALSLITSIWFSKDESMEGLKMLVRWEKWLWEGVVNRQYAGPRMRTAAKQRSPEDARGGEVLMAEDSHGRDSDPRQESRDRKWYPLSIIASIWFSQDEAMEGWATLNRWVKWLWKGLLYRQNDGPMLRTAAKQRWLEDARGGEFLMTEGRHGRDSDPRQEARDRRWCPWITYVSVMCRKNLQDWRTTIRPDGVWGQIDDQSVNPVIGDDDRTLELTWSGWRKIRSIQFVRDIDNIELFNFEIRRKIYLNRMPLGDWDEKQGRSLCVSGTKLNPLVILLDPTRFPNWVRTLGASINLAELFSSLFVQKKYKGWLVNCLQRARVGREINLSLKLRMGDTKQKRNNEQLGQGAMADACICQDQVVEFSTEDVAVSMQRAKMSLLGRLFIENRPSLSVIHKIVTNAWECRKKVQVLEAEMGLLQFLFDDAEDMEWVLKRTPWPVKDRVLHLQRWAPVTEEVFESLGFAPFGVQMWGIPSHCRTIAFGRRVAEMKLGEVIDVGLFGVKGESDQFVKARVKINVLEPLRSQVWASNEVAGKFWVTFAYEFLPLFCFHCGRLGHMERNCVYPAPIGEERYSQEMATTEVGFRLNEETLKAAQFSAPLLPQSVWVNPKTKGHQAANTAAARGEKRKAEEKGVWRDTVLAIPAGGEQATKGAQGKMLAAGARDAIRTGGSAAPLKAGRGSQGEEAGHRPKSVRQNKAAPSVGRGKNPLSNGGRAPMAAKEQGEVAKGGEKGKLRKEEGADEGRDTQGKLQKGDRDLVGKPSSGLSGASLGKDVGFGPNCSGPAKVAGCGEEVMIDNKATGEANANRNGDRSEAGMEKQDVGEKPVVLEVAAEVANEYGSNLPKLAEVFRMAIAEDELDDRKRAADMVEDLPRDPTPTKKICAEKSSAKPVETVEVASPKWPQSIK